MKRTLVLVFFAIASALLAVGRTWTSIDGRTLEGDLVRIEGEVAIVKMGKKEVQIPFSKLSPKDVEFLKTERDKPKPKITAGSLFGMELKAGATTETTGELDQKTIKALSSNKLKPTQIKVKISLPKDFDPSKPQKVFWTAGGINNEGERLKGNIGVFGRGNVAAGKGWIVIAADTEHGNPRESTIRISEGDDDFHQFLIAELTKVWPEFKSWSHACGGHSSGAKASFFRLAQLLKAKANAVGGFFSGCNGAYAVMASEESKIRKSAWRKVKGFQSTGDKDGLVNESHIEKVTGGMKAGGIKDIRSKTFAGGHSMNKEQLAEALDWFLEE